MVSTSSTLLAAAQTMTGPKAGRKDSKNRQSVGQMVNFDEGNPPRTLQQLKAAQFDAAKRYVFLSPADLSSQIDHIPQLVRQKCIVVFPCSRETLFPSRGDKMRRSAARMIVRPNFRRWLLQKEQDGMVFYFKPDRSYELLSDFLERIADPVTGRKYSELLLDSHWWRTKFNPAFSRFNSNPVAMVSLFQREVDEIAQPVFTSESESKGTGSALLQKLPANTRTNTERRSASQGCRTYYHRGGEWDITAVQELLYQSNPTLEPIMKWPLAPTPTVQPKQNPLSFLHLQPKAGEEQPNMSPVAKATLSAYRGYVSHEVGALVTTVTDVPVAARLQNEGTRLNNAKDFAPAPHARLDDLKLSWQRDMVREERQYFALSARSMSSAADRERSQSGSVSAR